MPVERLEYSAGNWIEPIRLCNDSSSRYIWSADPDIFCGHKQFCVVVVEQTWTISVKDLFCHTWVAAATIGAQSTVVEQQLVESKSIDVLSEPMINGESTVSTGGAPDATTRAG